MEIDNKPRTNPSVIKRCLKKTIAGATLTYEELHTVVVEGEMILNCRPLSYVSGKDT